jgi:hypothetical protein
VYLQSFRAGAKPKKRYTVFIAYTSKAPTIPPAKLGDFGLIKKEGQHTTMPPLVTLNSNL